MAYRKLLEKLLSEVLNETKFSYNDAFSPKNYEIREMKYSDGFAEYNIERDKIVMKKDVFRSLNKDLIIEVFEPFKEDKDNYGKYENDSRLKLDYHQKIDSEFIKNILKHEETHRQITHLKPSFNLDIFEPDEHHNELFLDLFKKLGGKLPDLYLKGDVSSSGASYSYLSNLLGLERIENIIFINEISSEYKNYSKIINKVKNYYLHNRSDSVLRVLTKSGALNLIKKGITYEVKINFDFSSNTCLILYSLNSK